LRVVFWFRPPVHVHQRRVRLRGKFDAGRYWCMEKRHELGAPSPPDAVPRGLVCESRRGDEAAGAPLDNAKPWTGRFTGVV
jgi:hypothetical protein